MKKKVLVIGDIFLDIFSTGTIDRISPESHVPVFKLNSNDLRLGGAANVALNLQLLNINTTLIGKISNDNYGREIKKILKKNRITLINLKCKKTIVKHRFMTAHGQVLRVDDEEISTNTYLDYKKISYQLRKKYDAIYISDYDKGFIDKKINKILINKKTTIFCDPKNKDLDFFKGFDFIKPNEKYIKNIVNEDFKEKKFIQNIRKLQKKYSIKNFIITLGDKGSLFINKKKVIFQKSKKINFYDLSGAGDTFGAVFLKAYLDKKNIKEILELSNFAAEKVICKKGTAAITLEELENNYQKIFYFKKDKFKIAKIIKKQQGLIGYTNGCFDLLHAGHISLLKFAKSECNYLICGINSDKSIRKLKGPKRPIVEESIRARLLLNLGFIDLVIIFDEDTPYEQIKLIKPNIIIKGSDYKINKVVGFDLIKKYGGKVKLAKILQGFSTTKIINNYEKSINFR
jgi:D-beta-D-heptose 7-phosphate kinase / D-beta-D-heptose 1-phosphate adenosyltransferase